MKKIKLLKGLICILGLFILTACSTQSNIESEQTEADYVGEESIKKTMEDDAEENEIGAKEEIVERITSREALDYMFDYLYPDKSNMTEIVLTDTEEELSYTFKFININSETNETSTSDPRNLYLSRTTEDGLYYQFALYEEIWNTIDGEEVFSHLSYTNHWYVNAETKEIIPRKIFNEEAEEDEVYLIFNEKFNEISRKYSAYEEE